MSIGRPDAATLWQSVRLFGACVIAYVAPLAVGLSEGYWAVITAVVVTQPMLSDTLSAGRDRIFGTLIGAVAGFLVLEAADHGWPTMPLFWMALAALTLLIAMRPYLRLCAVTLVVVVLVPGTGKAFIRPVDRVLEILLGTVAAIVLAAIIRPSLWRRGAASVAARARDEASEVERKLL